MTPLPQRFFARDTVDVARDLLGKLLVRDGAPPRLARVVEVEAYLGERDAASHARRGPTPRAGIMFGPPGILYVYLVYGLHHCMNIVTEAEGTAGAVLIRAAEPTTSSGLVAGSGSLSGAGVGAGAGATSGSGGGLRPLAGPGKLCAGLGITRAHNGLCLHLRGGEIFVADDGSPAPLIKASARVGVEYAGAWARRRLRFYIPGNPHVSAQPRA